MFWSADWNWAVVHPTVPVSSWECCIIVAFPSVNFMIVDSHNLLPFLKGPFMSFILEMEFELAGRNKQLARRPDCPRSAHRPARPPHNPSGTWQARATVSLQPTANSRTFWNVENVFVDGGSDVKSNFSDHLLHDRVHVLSISQGRMGCSLLS